MADSNNKRVLDLPEISTFSEDLYFLTEKAGGVTSKIRGGKIKPTVDATLSQPGIAADAKAVGDAITAESGARTTAINAAITNEVSARNTAINNAISTEVSNRNTAIGSAIETEVTDRNSAISDAIGTEVTNRNAAIDAAYNDLDEKKADNNLLYSDLSAGTSEELSSDNGVTDTSLYLTRKCSAIGDRAREVELVGGSVAWNQLIYDGNFTDANNFEATYGTISAANNVLTYSVDTVGSEWQNRLYPKSKRDFVKGHKYLVAVMVKGLSATFYFTSYSTASSVYAINGGSIGTSVANTWTTVGKVFNCDNSAYADIRLSMGYSGKAIGDSFDFKNFMLIDLTQAFGSTIADAIYAMETAKAGSGVAWFKKYYPLDYYPYNAGSLDSVEVTEKVATGFNQFDKSDYQYLQAYINYDMHSTIVDYGSTARQVIYMPCFPNTKYCASRDAVVSNDRFYLGYTKELPKNGVEVFGLARADYDQTIGKKMTLTTTTSSDAKYLVIWVGWTNASIETSTLCVSFSDSYKDGTYEPYKSHTYNYGNVVLRGIPKLVDGKLTYDGDIRKPNGTVQRRYGIVDLGSLTWTYSSQYSIFIANSPSDSAPNEGGEGVLCVCEKYVRTSGSSIAAMTEGSYIFNSTDLSSSKKIAIKDTTKGTDPTAFKTAMSGVYLVYPLATPTTESVDPYSEYQYVSNEGIEKYVANNYTPVGHTTFYMESQKKKLDLVTYPAEAIVRTSSGAIASFDDGGNNYPMKSLKVNIVPKQAGSGDPSPSNVRAISGWTQARIGINSKNYFPFPPGVKSVTKDGITWTLYKDEYGRLIKIKAKGTATASTSFSFASTALGHYWLPKGHYKLLILGDVPSAGGIWDLNIRKEGSDTDIVATTGIAEITLTEMTEFKSAYFYVYNNHTIDAEFCPAILQFNDTTPSLGQAPCVPPTVPLTIPFGQTVYGGTLDVVSGKLSITRVLQNMGDLTWYKARDLMEAIPNNAKGFPTDDVSTALCSQYKTVSYGTVYAYAEDKTIAFASNGRVYVYDTTYTDNIAFKTAMNGVQLAYELATPIEIDLTPTEVKSLLGDNNVWADAGEVEVEYRADTTLAYNKLMAMIASLA